MDYSKVKNKKKARKVKRSRNLAWAEYSRAPDENGGNVDHLRRGWTLRLSKYLQMRGKHHLEAKKKVLFALLLASLLISQSLISGIH